jgi:hypothetical protein
VPQQIERLFDHFVGAVLDHEGQLPHCSEDQEQREISQGVIWTLLPRNGGT